MAAFGELSDLDFIILVIGSLPLPVLGPNTQAFDLSRESFDLDCLEDHDEVDFRGEVFLAVTGEVLDTRSECKGEYLLS